MWPSPFITVVALLSLAARAADLDDPVLRLQQQRLEETRLRSPSPRAAASLIRLHLLKDQVEDLRPIVRAEQALAADPKVNPLLRAEAQLLLLELERSRGRSPRVADLDRELGFLHGYYVLGGFDNEGKHGCAKDFGPEKALDLKATYSGKARELTWHRLTAASWDGFTDLGASVRPNHDAVAYAVTFLKSATARNVQLALGTSGAHKLWVNGKLADADETYHPVRPDQTRLSVHLNPGLNRIMVKVCQDQGLLGFYLRAEGGGVKAVLPDILPALPRGGGPAARRLPTLTSVLAAQVKAHPGDSELRADYATVLNRHRSFDQREHLDARESEHAARSSSRLPATTQATLWALAGKYQEEDLNRRRTDLEAASLADPENAPIASLLAMHELGTGHADRARERLEKVLAQHPNYPEGELLLARVEEDVGLWPRASERIEAQLRKFPQLPSVTREAARVARRMERPEQAVNRFRVALALRYDDVNSRRALAGLLGDLARVDEAAQEYQTLLALDPSDNGSRLKLAGLLCANGRLEEGLARYAEARASSPDEPDVYEQEGRALIQAGQAKDALASFEHALLLRPQNPGLREVMRSLKGQDAASGAQYALDLRPLVREADSFENEDVVVLADYSYNKVQSSGLSSTYRQLGVKVYSDRGVDAYRTFPISYSPARQDVAIIRARITKADGSILDGYGETDRNVNEPWTGMYYDARAKVLSFPSLAKGDVLELQYRIEDTAQDNLLSDYWGNVDFVQGPYPKVRYQFYVDMPTGRPLYWNSKTLGAGVLSGQQPLPAGRMLYTWKVSRVSKVIPEPQMPGWAEVANTLHVSTYQTWDQVGRYYWGLVQDQLTPNDEIRKTVDSILKGVNRKDELAVVRAIYNFVVTNTRYVALEFGIHSFKPYPVDRILARRFGDCKDKASLIFALLKVAHVDSRLVLLRMRTLGALSEEPASLAAFNHAIVYVPKFNLFLDGTAEFTASSELPSADRLANVLIIEPGGNSRFLTTPESRADQNRTGLTMEVALKGDGSASIHGSSAVTGQNAGEYRRTYQSLATRKATFEQGWAQLFPGLSVKKVSLNDTRRLDQDVAMDYELGVPRYAEVLNGGGLRFSPFGTNRAYTQAYAPLVERHQDVLFPGPWVNEFHFRYALPKGFTAASLPPDLRDETPYGSLVMTFQMRDGKLLCDGTLKFPNARIKASDYPVFRGFVQRVDEAFSRKVVVRAESATRAEAGSPALAGASR